MAHVHHRTDRVHGRRIFGPSEGLPAVFRVFGADRRALFRRPVVGEQFLDLQQALAPGLGQVRADETRGQSGGAGEQPHDLVRVQGRHEPRRYFHRDEYEKVAQRRHQTAHDAPDLEREQLADHHPRQGNHAQHAGADVEQYAHQRHPAARPVVHGQRPVQGLVRAARGHRDGHQHGGRHGHGPAVHVLYARGTGDAHYEPEQRDRDGRDVIVHRGTGHLEKVDGVVQDYVDAAGLLQHEEAHENHERFPHGRRREVFDRGPQMRGTAAAGGAVRAGVLQRVKYLGQFLVGQRRPAPEPHQRLARVRHPALGRQPRRRFRRQVHGQEADERRDRAQDGHHLPRHDRTQRVHDEYAERHENRPERRQHAPVLSQAHLGHVHITRRRHA